MHKNILTILQNLLQTVFDYKIFRLWYWKEVKYNTRKILRLPIRIIEFLPILINDEDWSFDYILSSVLVFKLRRLQKQIKENGGHTNTDKYAKQISIVLGHIERYYDIVEHSEKYVEQGNLDWTFEKTEDGYNRIIFNTTKRDDYLTKRNLILVKWHYEEIFRKLGKWSNRWAD